MLTASHHLISDDGVIIIKAGVPEPSSTGKRLSPKLVAVIKELTAVRKPSRNPSGRVPERAPLVLKGAKSFCKGAAAKFVVHWIDGQE
ncbi:hypothetical protein KCP73_06760 [Salmonella enterica subsp. enterica]|nr:hypothetical protein KCP73_06760 [Salmonella enterica subsp. enterica]